MNSNLQGLLSALEKPKSNPVWKVSFHSDKVNESEIISEYDKKWNSLVTTKLASHADILWQFQSNVVEWQIQ